MSSIAGLVVVVLGAYLLGSVLFGVVFAGAVSGVDPRSAGSGSPGATNVMRIGGKRLGALVLLFDAGKGAVAVLLARGLSPPGSVLPAVAAVAVVLGHLFPVYYRFRGGKGVATAAGAFAALGYQPVVASFLVFITVLAASRFVSLASMVAAVSLAPFCLAWGKPHSVTVAAALTGALVVIRHRANLARLRRGLEPRLGEAGPRQP